MSDRVNLPPSPESETHLDGWRRDCSFDFEDFNVYPDLYKNDEAPCGTERSREWTPTSNDGWCSAGLAGDAHDGSNSMIWSVPSHSPMRPSEILKQVTEDEKFALEMQARYDSVRPTNHDTRSRTAASRQLSSAVINSTIGKDKNRRRKIQRDVVRIDRRGKGR